VTPRVDPHRWSPSQRLGGTFLVAGLWAGVAWMAWRLVWPGPTPELDLAGPTEQRYLPLDTPLQVSGKARRASRIRCEGRQARPNHQGRFELYAPGPTRPGMYVVRCEAENRQKRRFPFTYARLAGPSRNLADPIGDAVVLVLPLDKLKAKGGLLHGLSRLVSGPLAQYLKKAAGSLVFRYGDLRLGPVHVGAVTLLGVEAAADNRLAVTLGLRNVSVGIHLPDKWVTPNAKTPTWARMLGALVAGQQTIRLRTTLPLRFLVRWASGQRPTLSVGPLSTDLLKKALGLAFLADAANTMLSLLSGKLHAELNRAVQGAKTLASHMDRIYQQVQQRLGRMASLLPPLPKTVSPQQVATCLSLRLDHLTTSAQTKVVRFHLTARIKGYAMGGQRCDDPRSIHPLDVGSRYALRRLLLGPPPLRQVPDGPALIISHDLINAYLATVWASGGLSRVPIRLPALKQNGFDLRQMSYRLPPVVTTHRGLLRLEIPELWVYLQTRGEPGRLFAAHLRTALRVQVHAKERLRFVVDRQRRPKIWVRCLKEAGGACAAQSRRFQSLVNVGMELAFSPELAGPDLALEAALPPLRGPGMDIRLDRVQAIDRGVMVYLKIE
jgi:hypothetical protein